MQQTQSRAEEPGASVVVEDTPTLVDGERPDGLAREMYNVSGLTIWTRLCAPEQGVTPANGIPWRPETMFVVPPAYTGPVCGVVAEAGQQANVRKWVV